LISTDVLMSLQWRRLLSLIEYFYPNGLKRLISIAVAIILFHKPIVQEE
jgi:hypothetical protein